MAAVSLYSAIQALVLDWLDAEKKGVAGMPSKQDDDGSPGLGMALMTDLTESVDQ